jgi:hypothetical protein
MTGSPRLETVTRSVGGNGPTTRQSGAIEGPAGVPGPAAPARVHTLDQLTEPIPEIRRKSPTSRASRPRSRPSWKNTLAGAPGSRFSTVNRTVAGV